MGAGDDIMATGMARGAAERGKRVAFGDGRRIIWGPYSAEMFKNNPNVASPGDERASDLEWVRYYKGHRVYNRQEGDHWVWNKEFRPKPGQFFFDEAELAAADEFEDLGIVVVEPNVPRQKSCAPNKQWSVDRYQAVADHLSARGFQVLQFHYDNMTHRLDRISWTRPRSLRYAAAIMSLAKGYVGAEGGLHHAAAAVGIPAVVLFGGWIPPETTGYSAHFNIAVGEACGKLKPCDHCRASMDSITVDQVVEATEKAFS